MSSALSGSVGRERLDLQRPHELVELSPNVERSELRVRDRAPQALGELLGRT